MIDIIFTIVATTVESLKEYEFPSGVEDDYIHIFIPSIALALKPFETSKGTLF